MATLDARHRPPTRPVAHGRRDRRLLDRAATVAPRPPRRAPAARRTPRRAASARPTLVAAATAGRGPSARRAPRGRCRRGERSLDDLVTAAWRRCDGRARRLLRLRRRPPAALRRRRPPVGARCADCGSEPPAPLDGRRRAALRLCSASQAAAEVSPSRKVRTSQGKVVGKPTRGNPRESATETHRRWPRPRRPVVAQARVKWCGKSAPASW